MIYRNGYEVMSEEEYHKMMRNLLDSDVVPVGYLKDKLAWIREVVYSGKKFEPDGLIMLAERLLLWMSKHSSTERMDIIN